MSSSIYIHIPFCHHICHYCDFNKVFMKGQPVEKYIDMLIREFSMKTNEGHRVKTVFVGGGTPTALTAAQLEQLCEGISRHFQLEEGAEYTFEANPGDLTPDKIQVLKNHGVNRLSFGVQSFNDRLLERIGRGHRSSDVYRSIEDAQKAGITNLSVDLIYALPDQTLEDFEDTLKKAIELDLPHYSGYSLIVEPKTVFYNLMRKGKLPLPGEDAEAAMYELLMKQMEAAGRNQYEISNFALPGFESEHNKVYWKNESYFGLGAGAHGYVDGVRYSNIGPVNKYIQSVEEAKEPVLHSAAVTLAEKMEEELFLGLRMSEGVSGDTFLQKYGKEMDQVFRGPIQEMTKRNLLQYDQNRLKLTKEGRFLGNEVFQAFLGIN
ncbi:radical SAM family heme chaperone HemW [Jeotgalibacillus sp. R-1-5s-1]|uniref:radical SAM family heme chaperone HemW n=1 Tax=Jeotgalibacillus sp. R-1-5s-1 TaxID=2555897 RepID=UPI00106920C8|nr:radical SAM family heme chaperone HemW [Jeotgalibacillus sp. R-1-5s-1]TFD92343.1 oxygen-independent coproporphyrinogen III oxidase [Jeotgalibacillus sp. R-1-5s-1]